MHALTPLLSIAAINVWTEERNLRWSPQDIDDVDYYLDRTYYRFE
jgi:hypothetical protein